MTSYPAVCSLGHSPVHIANDVALQMHIAATHPRGVAQVRAALGASSGQATAAVQVDTPTGALGRLGILPSKLIARAADTVAHGNTFSEKDAVETFISFCAALDDPIDGDFGMFLLDFTYLFLDTCGSEEWNDAGGFTPYRTDGTRANEETWQDFKVFAVNYWKRRSKLFTPRKLGLALTSQMEELYFNPKIKAFDTLKNHGSGTSRRFMYSNGNPVECWVCVPGLWPERLSPDQVEMRAKVTSAVRKFKQSGTNDSYYLGLDPEHSYLNREADKAGLRAKINASTNPGLGAPGSPGNPSIMQSLYPSLFKPSGAGP